MAENFLDRLTQPARRDAAPIATPITAGTATAYAAAALAGEVGNLQAVPIGSGRNDQLNRSAVKMYGLAAAGEIDEHTVTQTLGAADGGLDHPATARTLRSARDAVFGRLGARTVTHTTTTTPREVAPWEQSDDPLSEHYVAPSSTPSTTSTSSPTTSTDAAATTSGASTATTSTSSSPDNAPNVAGASTPNPDAADQLHTQLVRLEAGKVRLQREARRLVDHEDATRDFRVPPFLDTLTAELLIPDEPITYRVDQLIPTGANVLLTAQYKTGKTTLVNNLARSLVDGVPFLGRYDVDSLNGRRVALFNYEVDRAQYRRWLRETGIVNTDHVAVLNLRGYRLPLGVPHVERWVVDWLSRANAAVWIVDPFARAFTGGDENDNGEVGVWLDTLDVIKSRAGVGELVLPNHTGRGDMEQGEERGRGATRLDDWADVRWLYTKDKTETRYFRATGRDVEVDEAAIAFEPTTRILTVTGGDRATVARSQLHDAVLEVVRNRPGIGVSELREGVRQQLGSASSDRVRSAVEALTYDRQIHTAKSGHAIGHYVGPASASQSADPLAA